MYICSPGVDNKNSNVEEMAKAAEESSSEEEEGEEGEDGSGSESEDPEKLWCICRQPHDDRCVFHI